MPYAILFGVNDTWYQIEVMNQQRLCKQQIRRGKSYHLFDELHIRRMAARLFDQQMWCWGRDIVCEHGNFLIEYGFNRVPSPDSRFSSRYEFCGSQNSIILWGFALWYTHSGIGSLLLKRHDFRPQINLISTASPAIWRVDEDLCTHWPHTDEEVSITAYLSTNVFRFIAEYELWVMKHAGLAYRERVVSAYPDIRKGYIPAQEMSLTWARLAEDCQP